MAQEVVSYPSARPHLGVTEGPFARAHYGVIGLEEIVIQPQPPTQPSAPSRPTAAAPILRAARSGAGGGGGGAFFGQAAFALLYREPLFDHQLEQAATQAADLAQNESMQQWLGSALSEEATKGRSVITDTAVAEIILERIQVAGAAPLVRTTQLAAGYVALGLQVVVVGHDVRRSLTAVYVDGQWAYADPQDGLPLGGHELFTREKFYKIPPLPDPAPTKAELELRELRAEMARMRAELDKMQQQLAQLADSILTNDLDVDVNAMIRRERAQARMEALVVVGGVTVAAALAIWWWRAASASDATDE